MEPANSTQATLKSAREQGDLVRRYGKIGISAVAAALACASKATNSDPAMVEHRIKEPEMDTAA